MTCLILRLSLLNRGSGESPGPPPPDNHLLPLQHRRNRKHTAEASTSPEARGVRITRELAARRQEQGQPRSPPLTEHPRLSYAPSSLWRLFHVLP